MLYPVLEHTVSKLKTFRENALCMYELLSLRAAAYTRISNIEWTSNVLAQFCPVANEKQVSGSPGVH